MGPSRHNYLAIGPRASKEEFLRALGIGHLDQVEEIYKKMREEAIKVFEEINTSPSNLVESKRHDSNYQPPYYWHHIRPEVQTAMQRACWQRAKPGSIVREMFDRGATSGEHSPNWVTLWLLYSVFRARDDRNNRKGRMNPGRRNGEGKILGGYPSSTQIGSRTLKYDPIRDFK